MKLALFGATGMIGSRVLAEAVRREHEVVAIARDASKIESSGGVSPRQGSAFDAAFAGEVAAGADVVIMTISPRVKPEGSMADAARILLDAVRHTGNRLLIVGGAGSLEAAPGVRVIDTPMFPEEYRAESLAMAEVLDLCRAEAQGDAWTVLCPSGEILPGERTGTFRLGTDQLLVDADGHSRISAEDFAIALVDEVEKPAHTGRRFTVGY